MKSTTATPACKQRSTASASLTACPLGRRRHRPFETSHARRGTEEDCLSMAERTASDDPRRHALANFNTIAAAYDTLRFVQVCAGRLIELAALPPGRGS